MLISLLHTCRLDIRWLTRGALCWQDYPKQAWVLSHPWGVALVAIQWQNEMNKCWVHFLTHINEYYKTLLHVFPKFFICISFGSEVIVNIYRKCGAMILHDSPWFICPSRVLMFPLACLSSNCKIYLYSRSCNHQFIKVLVDTLEGSS